MGTQNEVFSDIDNDICSYLDSVVSKGVGNEVSSFDHVSTCVDIPSVSPHMRVVPKSAVSSVEVGECVNKPGSTVSKTLSGEVGEARGSCKNCTNVGCRISVDSHLGYNREQLPVGRTINHKGADLSEKS